MILINTLFLSLLAAAPPADAAKSARPSQLVVNYCEIGDHYQFERVECPIELRNMGDAPISVSHAEAKLAWDSIEQGVVVVPPKGTSYLKAQVDLRNDEGMVRRAFRFRTDEPGQPYRGSEVRGYVQSVLEQSRPKLDFGVVRLSERALPAANVELSSREHADFRIEGIESAPEWLDVKLGVDRRTVRAQIRDTAPWGVTHLGKAFVKLKAGASVTTADLMKHLEPKISRIELPAQIEIRDALPKTMIGKLSKKELVAEEKAKREKAKG